MRCPACAAWSKGRLGVAVWAGQGDQERTMEPAQQRRLLVLTITGPVEHRQAGADAVESGGLYEAAGRRVHVVGIGSDHPAVPAQDVKGLASEDGAEPEAPPRRVEF